MTKATLTQLWILIHESLLQWRDVVQD